MDRWQIISRLMVIGGLAALLSTFALAAEGGGFVISQTSSWLPRITAYVDFLDENGEPVNNIRVDQFSASVQERPVKVVQALPFEDSGEGVAYIFLIDISKSIEDSQFDEMRQAVYAWIDGMKPADRMAIYAFGDDSKTVIDFTSGKQDLKDALATLKPVDGRTLVHLALDRALDLGNRSDVGLPGRRAIVVLTDGKDEGSGLTAEDVIRRKITSGTQPAIPIYAIGYSHLPPKERRVYLDELHRFAVVSGGAFEEAGARPLRETYAQMNRAIRRVFVLQMECNDCKPDLQAHSLQISANVGGIVQSSMSTVRFQGLPQPSLWTRWGMWAIGGAILLAVVIGAVSLTKRKQKETVDFPPPVFGAGGIRTEPAPRLRIKLDVIKGRDPGAVHEIGLHERAAIGRSNGCELALSGDDISGRHCELTLEEGRVFLRDSGSTNGTMLNGVKIAGRERVETGDVIRLGHTELRITIGQAQ